jgi:hypothetical protein
MRYVVALRPFIVAGYREDTSHLGAGPADEAAMAQAAAPERDPLRYRNYWELSLVDNANRHELVNVVSLCKDVNATTEGLVRPTEVWILNKPATLSQLLERLAESPSLADIAERHYGM